MTEADRNGAVAAVIDTLDRHIVEMPLARISSQRLLPDELRGFLGIEAVRVAA